jgi:hypothetical protein
MSESTPDGIASSRTGSVPAAWIADTASGEADRSVTSQALATSRMKLPMLPRTVASQIMANNFCRSGAKAPGGPREAPALRSRPRS